MKETTDTNKILNGFVKFIVYPWVIITAIIVIGFITTLAIKAS